MRFLISFLTLLFLLLPPLAREVEAQSTDAPKVVIDKRKLLVPPRNLDGSFIVTPFTEDPVRWMRDKQQNFYRSISGSIRALKSGSPATAAWTLLTLSFLYGIFHAAGPGHGKAVISAWVLATENELKRGIVIAAMSAFFQSMTAIVIVSALLLFVNSAAGMARDVAGFLESASYLMIAGLGAYLLVMTFKPHGHAALSRPVPGGKPQFEIVNPLLATHAHDHVHDENCDCSHAHAPNPADLRGDWSWHRAVTLAFAVGLRPCTGALLVLMFSWGLGLYWAGIAATLAMGLGVFITISAIATLAVYGKALALRYSRLSGRKLALAVKGLRVVCGAGIMLLGGLMFWASLGSVNTML